MDNWWDSLYKRAKSLEVKLEKKIQSYSSLSQRINANFISDEESGLIEGNEEHTLSTEIERDLAETMRQGNGTSLTNQQEAWIKRYYEMHFDYSTEFRTISESIRRKKESMEIIQSTKKTNGSDEKDSSMQKLIKEKLSIAASMRSINEVISQAFETKNSLSTQRNSLSNATTGISNVSTNIPSIGRLIEGIQKKKYRETIIISVVVASLLCFTIWWICLR